MKSYFTLPLPVFSSKNYPMIGISQITRLLELIFLKKCVINFENVAIIFVTVPGKNYYVRLGS